VTAAAPAVSKPVTPPAPTMVPPKLDTGASVRVPTLTFSDPEPTPPSAQSSRASDEPYHIGKGLRIEDIEPFELDLYDDPPAKPATAPQAPAAPNGAVAKVSVNAAAAA